MKMEIKKIQSRDGFTYWIEIGDKLYESRILAGSWQSSNFKFAKTLIDNWTRCIDIGSNMACSAVQYSQAFKIVECFEPTPLNIELWKNTIRDNHIANCNLYEVALGNKEFIEEIVVHKHNGGHNHLENKNILKWTGKKWIPKKINLKRRRQTIPVTVRPLDYYNFKDVGFMKLDVEGYEKFVLEGAMQTITQSRPTLQLEIRANQCRKFGYWAEDMIESIRKLDYVVMSKKRGALHGTFKSYRNQLLYDNQYYKGEMDLFFQPNERMKYKVFDSLFELL